MKQQNVDTVRERERDCPTIERLQTLIDSLEKMREEENSNTDSTQNTNDMNIVDNTAVESMNNQNTMDWCDVDWRVACRCVVPGLGYLH